MDNENNTRYWLNLPIPDHIKKRVDQWLDALHRERYAELYPGMTMEEAKQWEAKLKNGMLTFKDEEE